MPLLAPPDAEVATLCATFDWNALRPGRAALARDVVERRIAEGDRPARVLPLACSRGRFRVGRFVDEEGNVYRVSDVALLLGEVPETRPDLDAYRRARVLEGVTVGVAAAASPTLLLGPGWWPVYLGVGVLATNQNGTARASLARAVATYNAATFWEQAEDGYAALDPAISRGLARTTELVHRSRGCVVAMDDPDFVMDAAVVWSYAEAGYDAGALLQAAERAPAGLGCDLSAVMEAGLAAEAMAQAPTFEE